MRAKFYFSIFISVFLIKICASQKKAVQKCKSYKQLKVTKTLDRLLKPTVVGGTLTIDNEFPHMVALGYGNLESPQFLCGGTLISDLYVLTAAHCTSDRKAGSVKMVRAGTRRLTAEIGLHQDVPVKNIIKYPKYKPPSSYHDIALIRLKNKVTFAPNILPACLQTTKELPLQGKSMIALGWGKTDFAGPSSDNLLKVFLQHSPINQCKTSYQSGVKSKLPRGILDNIQICAGGTVGKDTCQGDSGGPLQYINGGSHYIVGLTSFGKACGLAAAPGIYTRVSAYIPWIENLVWK